MDAHDDEQLHLHHDTRKRCLRRWNVEQAQDYGLVRAKHRATHEVRQERVGDLARSARHPHLDWNLAHRCVHKRAKEGGRRLIKEERAPSERNVVMKHPNERESGATAAAISARRVLIIHIGFHT